MSDILASHLSLLDEAIVMLQKQKWVHNDLNLRGTEKEKWRKQGDPIIQLRNWHSFADAIAAQTKINEGTWKPDELK